jgi:hypothetical protein
MQIHMSEFKEKLLGLTKLRYETLPLLMENMQVGENLNIGDPISRILKCHLLSEAVMDRLIQLAFKPNGDAILSARLSYSQKLDIVSRTMLFEDYPLIPELAVGSLRKLNRIRNRLSHELGASVTQEEAIELFMGVDPLMPVDPIDADVPLLIYHYTSFIFGSMLPKYESDEEQIA